MEKDIITMISTYFGEDYDPDMEGIILLLIQSNIGEFKAYMNYPSAFTEEKIDSDLQKNKYCIFWCTIYDLIMQGYEFQNSHSENGVNRSWKNKYDIYATYGIVPYAST